MKIYIPSLQRATRQGTWAELQNVPGADACIVVGPEDAKAYVAANPAAPLLVLPKSVRGIGKVRQWLLEHHAKNNADPRMAMMDDDLLFRQRLLDDPTRALHASTRETATMLKTLNRTLKVYAHGGVLPSEGANRNADHEVLENARMLRVLAYDAKKVLDAGVKFSRLPVMEDFDVTLQLLRKGFKNFVLCGWWHNQAGSALAGGCSVYRDAEMQAAGAHGLKKLHPDFVTVVEKTTKGAWGGGTRTDVKIAWKKAYASSQRS